MHSFLRAASALFAIAVIPGVHADDDAWFLRDAFGDRPDAGYRWASGWMLSGRANYRYDELAFSDATNADAMLFVGKRWQFDEAEHWLPFWDAELGTGLAYNDDDTLSAIELGLYVGGEVMLTERLYLAARVGAAYERREASQWVTRNELDVARAQLELGYYW